MELKGDFSSYSEILDLLQIVSIGKKTGEVLLNSNGESIILQIKKGMIVNFKTNIDFLEKLKDRVRKQDVSMQEAIKFLLHYVAMWDKGKFSFVEKDISEEIGKADTITIMMDFTKEQDEIADNLRDLFKRNPYFELSENISEPVTLDKEDWKLLSLLSKGNNLVKTIFLGASSFKTGLERIYLFLERNLIKEISDKKKHSYEEGIQVKETTKTSLVDTERIEKAREVLVETMGPMGEFLIEETLEDMELTKLPVNMIDTFVENLTRRIPDSCLIEGESCRERLKEEITHILKGGENEP